MDQDQMDSLRMLGTDFTTREAMAAVDWTGSRRALAKEIERRGYQPLLRRRRGENGVTVIWRAPVPPVSECPCRCHTGTCGENDMVLAERAIRLILSVRPIGADGMQAIVELVDRAGVNFARTAIGVGDLDDDVPF